MCKHTHIATHRGKAFYLKILQNLISQFWNLFWESLGRCIKYISYILKVCMHIFVANYFYCIAIHVLWCRKCTHFSEITFAQSIHIFLDSFWEAYNIIIITWCHVYNSNAWSIIWMCIARAPRNNPLKFSSFNFCERKTALSCYIHPKNDNKTHKQHFIYVYKRGSRVFGYSSFAFTNKQLYLNYIQTHHWC